MGKTSVLKEKPVPTILYPPNTPHDDSGTKAGLHSEKPVTKPPEPWHGQTYNLFISKMKVTIKSDESKALFTALKTVLHICMQYNQSLCCSEIYEYIWLCLAYISAKNNKI
jgi:hypothetical protein